MLGKVQLQYISADVNVYPCTGHNFTEDASAPSCTSVITPILLSDKTILYGKFKHSN